MSNSKIGSSGALANERDLPHIVEMEVPPEGFAHPARAAMEEFHRSHRIRARFGRRMRRDGKEYCRWCFADEAVADLFHSSFGGARITAGPNAADQYESRDTCS
jgi:hypothetical protein